MSKKRFDYSFKALWTSILITIVSDNESKSDAIMNSIFSYIQSFENEFSRFKQDSDLSKLNTNKSLDVSSEFIWLLIASKEIYKLTNWYFNPLTDIRKFGYIDNFDNWIFEKIDINEDLDFDKVQIFWNHVKLNSSMHLDFGAIWKWYLADRLKNILIQNWFNDFILNIGGDIVLWWKNLEWNSWSVGIQNPFWEWNIWVVYLTDSSISSSWTYLRNWEINGEKYSHIKNPFSDNPHLDATSITIIDKFGYRTDALATWIFAMWFENWFNFCSENNIDSLFVLNNKDIQFTKGFDKKYNLKLIDK